MGNRNISVSELARVFEKATDQTDLPEGASLRRLFCAQCADGSICTVSAGGFLIGDTLYCHKHEDHGCEGVVRVGAVLCDERLQKLKISILGYTLKNVGSPSLRIV